MWFLIYSCWVLTSPISSVQLLSCVWFSATSWTAARQASLSITKSWSLLKLMSIESVMPSNHLFLYHPLSSCLQSFPAPGSFPTSQVFKSGDQSIGASASASVLPMNIQDWYPLGLTGWISLQSKGLSRVFSNSWEVWPLLSSMTSPIQRYIEYLYSSSWSNSHTTKLKLTFPNSSKYFDLRAGHFSF